MWGLRGGGMDTDSSVVTAGRGEEWVEAEEDIRGINGNAKIQ